MKFGKKMKLPSTVEIKHQLLVRWLADQTAIEAAEASALASVVRAKGPRVQENPMTLLMIAAACSAALALTSVMMACAGTVEAPVRT